MKRTKKITLCAMLIALGVIVLLLGSVSGLFDMVTAVLASAFIIFCILEMGLGYGVAIYVATGVLALILLPEKTAAWTYVLFFGLHTILIPVLEKLGRVVSYILRLALMNASLFVLYFFFSALFELPEELWMNIVMLVVGNICFVLCDILYTRIIRLYFRFVRPHIAKMLK